MRGRRQRGCMAINNGKRSLAAGQLAMAAPSLWAAAYIHSPALVSFKPYYILSAAKGSVQLMSIVISACAGAPHLSCRCNCCPCAILGRVHCKA